MKHRLCLLRGLILSSRWTGWGTHHMMTVELEVDPRVYFAAAATVTAVPVAVKIFNWLATINASHPAGL